jgi:hypothetical protein
LARIDKAWFVVRGIAGTALTGCIGVVFSTGGSVVPAGTTAALVADGVVCIPGTITAGNPVGVLKEGEIVEFGGAASTAYYAGSNGSISTTATNSTKIGKTVEGDRLVVHM